MTPKVYRLTGCLIAKNKHSHVLMYYVNKLKAPALESLYNI